MTRPFFFALLVLPLLAASSARAQADWFAVVDSPVFTEALGVAPDGTGGAFVVGSFFKATDFDGDGVPDATSAGLNDGYVARYDARGTLLWVQPQSGTDRIRTTAVAADGAGGALAAGTFFGALDLDGDGTTDLASTGSADAFVARYDASGVLLAAQSFGGVEGVQVLALAADGEAGFVVGGSFGRDLDLDGDGQPDVTSTGVADAYVARFDAAGALLWAYGFGGDSDDRFDRVQGLAFGTDGRVLASGTFVGTADLDDDGQTDLESTGFFDLVVARYDAAGALTWARRAGATTDPFANVTGEGIAPDGAGGAFVTGRAVIDTDFDGDGQPDLPPNNEGYLARYGDDGAFAWVVPLGRVSGADLAADPQGGVALAGFAVNGADIDGDGQPDIAAQGVDVFVGRFDEAGRPRGFQVVLSEDLSPQFAFDAGRAVAVDQTGVLVAGEFDGGADFTGDGQPDATATAIAGFVARYGLRALPDETEGPPAQARLALYPNPTPGQATAVLTLDAPTDTYVEIVDLLGRRVAALHRGALGVGTHSFSLPSGLGSGVYVVRAVTRGAVQTQRFAVVR